MVETHTLYYKCLKCGKENSQIYVLGMGEPCLLECPYCGGPIEFERSCYVCAEQGTMECMLGCKDFKMFEQIETRQKESPTETSKSSSP